LQSPLGDIRGRALWVVVGCLVCQMGLGFVYSFAPLAGDLIDDFGWTRAEYSSARASQVWVMALSSPVVGFLTVRFGGRRVLSVSAVLLGVAFVGIGAMQSWLQFALLTVLMGLAVTGLGDIAVGAVAAQWVQRGRGLALGIVYTGSNLGGWLVSRLAAGLSESLGWREAVTIIGVGGSLLLLPFALVAVRDRPGARAAARAQGTEPGAGDSDLDIRAALRTRSFWVIALSLFAIFFFLVAVLEHLVLFLMDGGMERGEATAFYSNMIAMGLVSKVVFGLIADRLRPKTAIALDFGLLTASSLVLLLVTGGGALLWLFVVGFGFAYAARDVVTPLIVADCFGVRYLAQIYGALMITLLPAGTLGPIFAGAVYDRTGSYDPAFATFALVNGVSLLSLLLLRDERRPRHP
jgi:OFA family oxalate/formate antiporter-like MFS transporter